MNVLVRRNRLGQSKFENEVKVQFFDGFNKGYGECRDQIVGWLSNFKESCSNQVKITWWDEIQFNLANDSQGSNFMLEIVIAFKPLLAFLNVSKGLIWLTR